MNVTPTSPRLDALLARLRGRLTRQVWLHGLGTIMAAAAGWLLFIYTADRALHLPAAVRVVHTLVLLGLPVVLCVRYLVRPLRKVPGRAGLAVLVERAHPDTEDLLVSAVQLAPRAQGSPAAGLIARVVEDAEARVAGIDLGRVVDPRGPRLRIGAGAGLGLLAAGVLLASSELTGIFVARMLGANVPWPQRTQLAVEIPLTGGRAQVEERDGQLHVRAARGSDIPVLIRATGVVPDEVVLHFDGGHESALASGGTPLFKTMLRAVQDDLSFHVTGGDDRDGEPEVVVHVLQPPDVAGLAFAIEPPAYSGRPTRVVNGTDVEVLEGSRVTVHVLPDPPEANGAARLFPEDRSLPLVAAPFPVVNGAPAREGLAFEFVAETSIRFSFELHDETGLPNPDPGLFGVRVLEDRRPELALLAPGRAEVPVVAGGAVPLRVRVEDDFGVARLTWDVRAPQDEDRTLAEDALALQEVVDPEGAFSGVGYVGLARARLEVDALGGGEPLGPGQALVLQVVAEDTREPLANVSQTAPVRLRVVSGDEFLRRLKDGLARAGEDAGKLATLAQGSLDDSRELLAALSSDEPDVAGSGVGELVYGARRVQGDARALARELAGLAEDLLYSRVDERAGALLESIDQRLAQHADRSFHPTPWLGLTRDYEAGRLGQADLAGELVQMVGLSLAISEEHAQTAATALAEAQSAPGPGAEREALARAEAAQARAQEALDRLLVKLGEWDNFQSVLTLTRDILKRQKNLNTRTRQYAEDH